MKQFKTINQNKADIEIGYKEQKQHLIDIMKSDEDLGLYEEPKQEIKLEEVFNDEKKENIKKFIDEMREQSNEQETLEEVAERKFQNIGDRLIFEDGAKWQQERSYSEEEKKLMIKIFNSYWFENNPEHEDNLREYELSKNIFNQLK